MGSARRSSGRGRVLALAVAAPAAFAAGALVAGMMSGGTSAVQSPAAAAASASVSAVEPGASTSAAPTVDPAAVASEPAPSDVAPTPSEPEQRDPRDPSESAPATTSPGESAPGPAQRPQTDGTVGVVHSIDTDDPVYFITVDDGMHLDPLALRMVQQEQIPVTAFLTEWTTKSPEAVEYFKQITAYGGSIQNHTMLHASLAEPSTDLDFEICQTQRVYAERFGTQPWLLRPPYGAGYAEAAVQQTAASCGIDTIVMWNVTVAGGGTDVQYWEPPLRAGDIVLAHFEKDFSADLAKILELGRAQGLRPASLEAYLS